MEEGALRGLDQQQRAGEPAQHAGRNQRNQQAARRLQMARVRGHAGGESRPQRYGIAGVGLDRRYAGEHHQGERNEAAAASHGVEHAGDYAGEEQDDGLLEVQTLTCITEKYSEGPAFLPRGTDAGITLPAR